MTRSPGPVLPAPAARYDIANESQFRRELERLLTTYSQLQIGDITQYQDQLSIGWGQITGIPATFAPSAHTHPFSEITGQIANAQVPVGAVTQHQAALAIAASQVTAGGFGAGDYVFPGTLRVSNTAPILQFYETDAALNEKAWRIVASGGSLFFQGNADDGEPFANPLFMRFIRSGATAVQVDIGAFTRINHSLDEHLSLVHTLATGSPYLSFYQGSTHRGSLQYDNGTGMSLRSFGSGTIVRIIPDGVESLAVKNSRIDAYVKLYVPSFEDSTTGIGRAAHSLVSFDSASNFAQPSGYRTMARNTSAIMPPGWSSYYFWNVLARRDAGGGYYGIAIAYNDGQSWIGYNNVGTSAPTWVELYSERSTTIESRGDVIANV